MAARAEIGRAQQIASDLLRVASALRDLASVGCLAPSKHEIDRMLDDLDCVDEYATMIVYSVLPAWFGGDIAAPEKGLALEEIEKRARLLGLAVHPSVWPPTGLPLGRHSSRPTAEAAREAIDDICRQTVSLWAEADKLARAEPSFEDLGMSFDEIIAELRAAEPRSRDGFVHIYIAAQDIIGAVADLTASLE